MRPDFFCNAESTQKNWGEMGDRKVIKEIVMKKEPRLVRGFLSHLFA